MSLEGFEGSVAVRLLMDGAEVGSAVADATMDTSVEVQVRGTTGLGLRELAVYINGVASGTIPINFDE